MPLRTCLVTGKKAEQSAFFRFTIQDGKLVFDNQKKNPQRGGYICKSIEALEKLHKRKRKISHFLKIKEFEIDTLILEEQKKKIPK
jgi:predicted RNA-binding protein YlxR (DUF448 family)